MGEARHFTYASADGLTQIHALEWKPEQEIKGIIQIVHGMQEFVERYDTFAEWMKEKGYLIVGNDHLGHGGSVRTEARYGYFSKKDPDKVLIQDMRKLHKQYAEKYPKVPYIMLGHSMGSFLARKYLCMYGQELDGAIISGTAYHPLPEALGGMMICKLLARRKGWLYRSPFVTGLAMGNFNQKFEPARTPNDWLTRDESVVDAYNSDKRTQYKFTLNGYFGMFSVLKYLAAASHLSGMPKTLPVFFIAGEMDPVGNFGEGVKKVVVQFRSHGMKHVECRLYPNDRHEVLNELDKQDVYDDIYHWLEKSVIRPYAGKH